MADNTSPSVGSASPHVIRCAECHELVPADRVRHREERVKVAASPTPGRWRSGGPPIFRPREHRPRIGARSSPGVVHPAPPPRNTYTVDRIPVCVDCLRRQRTGLLAVCGIATACLAVALILYSQAPTAPDGEQIALLTPAAPPGRPSAPLMSPAAAPEPKTPAAPSPTAAPLPGVEPNAPPATSAPAPEAQRAPTASASAPPAQTPSAADADASPAATPIWAEHRAPARRAGGSASSHRAATPSASALALRKDGYAALERRRYGEALTLLQRATLMGDAYAPMYIGQLFEGGIGVPRDVGQASYWYGIAINRGNAMALAAFNRMRVSPY